MTLLNRWKKKHLCSKQIQRTVLNDKEGICPEVKNCMHLTVIWYKNWTLCNGSSVIRYFNTFAVLCNNVKILEVPERDNTCKSHRHSTQWARGDTPNKRDHQQHLIREYMLTKRACALHMRSRRAWKPVLKMENGVHHYKGRHWNNK